MASIEASETYGVPSGPVIRALITSTRVSSTRKKIEESQATGKFVVRIASYGNVAKHPEGVLLKKNYTPPSRWQATALEYQSGPTYGLHYCNKT